MLFHVSHQYSLPPFHLQLIMSINLAWRDERLTFYNLRPAFDVSQNYFNMGAIQDLWYPALYFPNAIFEDNLRISAGDKVKAYSTLIPETEGEPTVVLSYEGIFSIHSQRTFYNYFLYNKHKQD